MSADSSSTYWDGEIGLKKKEECNDLPLQELGGGHDIGGCPAVEQFVLHVVHIGGGVGEELAVAGTEVVEAGLAVCVAHEAVLGAFAMTGEQHAALTALAGQLLALHLGKFVLLGGIHHFGDGAFAQVAEAVLGIDEVVAGIHIAVELHDAGVATLLGQHAHTGGLAHPIGQRGVEELDEVVAHVAAHPLVEEGAKEMAPLAGRDREVCQLALFLHTRGQAQAVGARL